jgi:hypothetical protein
VLIRQQAKLLLSSELDRGLAPAHLDGNEHNGFLDPEIWLKP